MEDMFRIGVLSSPHGVKGEISIFPTSDDLNRYSYLDECYLMTKEGTKLVHVVSCKFKKGMPVLGFKEFSSIEEVENLRGIELFVSRDNAIPLEEGEYYMADIIGFDVISQGQKIGVLEDYTENGAEQTIFIVRMQDDSIKYILDIPEFVLDVNLEQKTINVNLMKGM
ncbi:MAG: ribosome maturation factor RimM [Eubacterium sp.]|nr:ribosome maturation factor RimM [Eubacterium sp.]